MRNFYYAVNSSIKKMRGWVSLLYMGVFYGVTEYSAHWILSSNELFYVLVPVVILFLALLAVRLLLGSINFHSKSLCLIYAVAFSYGILFGLNNFHYLSGGKFFFIVLFIVCCAIVQNVFLELVKFKSFRKTLECLVSTGLFFLLLRQLVIYGEKLISA